MRGIEIAARFALPPNSLRYCGGGEFASVFQAYLGKKNALNQKKLQDSLARFRAHHPYLKLIADANGLKPFDSRVAEAFWLGNGLLRNIRKKDVQMLILQEFCGDGMLTKKRAMELARSLPNGFLPHHSFHALYLHSITGVIAPSVKNADLCRVSWGRVEKAGRGDVVVETQKLVRKNGVLKLRPCKGKWKISCSGIRLLPDAKAGDLVASHWGVAVMKLTKAQAKRLKSVTMRNVTAANRMGKH